MQGSADVAKFRLRGSVQPPTYYFDTDSLVFGEVSFGFLHSKILVLANESEVTTAVYRLAKVTSGTYYICALCSK